MRLKTCLLGIALSLAACSPGAAGGKEASSAGVGDGVGDGVGAGVQAAPTVHPVSGLRIIPLTVWHKGKLHAFRVEVAQSSYEQGRGMMFRTAMGPDEGMLFPMKPARAASFWMRNTVIPLDIIFIGTDGRISNIAANAVPYDETPLASKGLVIAVLELSGGRAAELGIGPGDKVQW